ncbi:formaldehyde-activating enzyme [Actinomycetospora lemnae]|uniref:Formaldehyde-activating enzyme n=1 Tax=Actinomycetospora lemnae TaxID=3019891 RepID=A0ABT5T2R4_9PSEU|nr:formaldehyde-activating enzyme [Actinomycetospora sp. DW7H6]MDD7969289.1 formaldehyde-activating enzyme [Actinomycetospora sp. DW7H6]
MAAEDIDGRFAQGWGGAAPNGVHVNVLLARRGSATGAVVAGAFTNPSAGFTPVLASVGPDQQSYETVHPPTVVVNKIAPVDERHEKLIFGACGAGVARGVLDVVASGTIDADQDTLVLVSLWLDTAAEDETTVCANARTAVAAAVAEAAVGRDRAAVERLVAARDTVRHPFYDGA